MKEKILIVTTNSCGSENLKDTGVFLEEFALPYLIFDKTGYEILVASPKGGISPVDESSMSCSNPMEWDLCIKILRETVKLKEVNHKDFDALYFPGGHGPMFDLAFDEDVKQVVEDFYCENKIISAICHGVAALTSAKDKNGDSILKNKKVTSFTNKEEHIMKLGEFLPFLLEDKIKELGADFVEKAPWAEHVEVDENIITGQNQNSATLIAEKIIEKLQ